MNPHNEERSRKQLRNQHISACTLVLGNQVNENLEEHQVFKNDPDKHLL